MRRTLTSLRRTAQISRVLLHVFVFRYLTTEGRHQSTAHALRLGFEELGVTWVLLGERLSLRADILPTAYCREFRHIATSARRMSLDEIHEVITTELGGAQDRFFASLDLEPIRTTPIAQVHHGLTADSRRPIAVKLQNPDVQRWLSVDLGFMRAMSSVLDWFGVLSPASARSFAIEFARSATNECDFRIEARNAQLIAIMARDISDSPAVTVHLELSGRSILTSELIEGIPIRHFLDAIARNDHAFLHAMKRRGYDLTRIGRNIHWNLLNQVFRDGFFHAQLRTDALLVLPSNNIIYLDNGVVGRASAELQASLRYVTRRILQNHMDYAIEELLRWIGPTASTNMARARQDLAIVLEDYVDGFESSPDAAPWLHVPHVSENILAVMRDARLTISPALSLYLGARQATESLVLQLAPQLNLLMEQRRFLARGDVMDAGDFRIPSRILSGIQQGFHDTRQLFSDLNRIQSSTRVIEISLRTLQIRLLGYGVWAAIIGVGLYLLYNDTTFDLLRLLPGSGRFWGTTAVIIGAVVFLTMILRQGRKLASMDSVSTNRRDAFRNLRRMQ